MHGKAANRRTPVRRTLARAFAGWRTGLAGPVIVPQAGTAVSDFGPGLIVPFQIIYPHQARGFPTATAGLVLAAVRGTAAVLTPSSGPPLDRFRAKPILITGDLASALGYAGLPSPAVPGTPSSARPPAAPGSQSRPPRTRF